MEWKELEDGYINLELKLMFKIWDAGEKYAKRWEVSFLNITTGSIGYTIAAFETKEGAHNFFEYLTK